MILSIVLGSKPVGFVDIRPALKVLLKALAEERLSIWLVRGSMKEG